MLKIFPARSATALRALAVTPLLALSLSLSLAACGPSGSDAAGAGGGKQNPSASTSSGSPTDWYVKYASCMRGQGIDIPDPAADGAVTTSRDVATDAGKAADASCRKKLGDPPASMSGSDPQSQAEQEASALAITKCLREKGYDVPDAKPNEALGLPDDVSPEALQACGLSMAATQ